MLKISKFKQKKYLIYKMEDAKGAEKNKVWKIKHQIK